MENLRNDIEKSLKGGVKIGEKMLVLYEDLLDVINFGMLKNLKKINTKLHIANEQLESIVKNNIGIPLNDTLMKLKEKLNNFSLDDLKEDLNSTIYDIKQDLINALSKKNLTNTPLMKFLEKFKKMKKFNYMDKIVSSINDTLTDFNKKIVEQLYNLQEKVNEIEEIKNRHNESNIKEIILFMI